MPATEKGLLQMLHKTSYDLFSDTVENYVNSRDKNYINSLREDINHSSNFLRYLISSTRQKAINKNITTHLNLTFSKDTEENNEITYESNFSAALIQLFIVVLIFLIVFLVCKCNTILKYFRDFKFFPVSAYSSTSSELCEDAFKPKTNFQDLLCYSCYRIRMKRRFKNRRLRNQRFNRNRAIRKHERMERRSSIYHRNRSESVRTKPESSNLKLSNYTLSGSIKVKRQKSVNSSTRSALNNNNSRLQIQRSVRASHV